MDKLTQEELNGLSPRARKQHEDSNTVLSEITTENPNIEDVVNLEFLMYKAYNLKLLETPFENELAIIDARPHMISNLDKIRDLL